MRELFVKDYETWVLYESVGSARMNKVARSILATYCPFSKAIRQELSENPMMKDVIGLGMRNLEPRKKHIDLLLGNIAKMNLDPPEELVEFRKFFDL